MIPINGNVNAMPRKVSCKLVIGGNTITDVKLLTYSSDWSGDITIGQVVSSYINCTIPTPGFSLTGANVSHSMGIGSPAEWVAIGQYTVDKNSIRTRQGYTSFSAYDKLHDTVNTYYSSLTFPTTAQAVCNEVCGIIGITSTSLPINFTIAEDILSGYTLRDVLGFIAALCGKNAYLNADNQLELRWFTASGYTADGTRANVPYIGENNCTVNRLICQSQDGTLTSGSGQGIYFTCPIMTQDWIDWLQSQLSGLTYRKADVDIPYGNFCLQSGDIITVTTTGQTLTVPIMQNSWTYDGGLSSAVSAYGVSDYSGTANSAERSVSAQRVQGILDAKRAASREAQQYITIQGDIAYATELITGAQGGIIRINMGGNGKPAEFLILDTGDIQTAVRVFRLNENGLGFSNAGYNGPYETAITYDGLIVADRISGNKISGVKFESLINTINGVAPHILIENGGYTINKVSVTDGQITSGPDVVGKLHFIDRSRIQGERDTVALQVANGDCFIIGTLDPNGWDLGTSDFIYYSDLSTAPSGAEKFQLYGNMKLFGNLFFGSGATDNLNSLKSTVDSLSTAVSNLTSAINTINGQIADLDRRVTALENA